MPSALHTRLAMLTAALALALCACGASNPDSGDGGPADGGIRICNQPDAGEFIALLSDLQDYESWETFVLPDGQTGQGIRHVYLNQRPPPGSCAFPVGTIIVKHAPAIGLRGTEQIDAMVKRGAGYNDGGATGWQWFGLARAPNDGGVTIAWSGTVPPPNAGYGPGNADCNGCHGLSGANDYVKLPPDAEGQQIAAPLRLDAN